MALCVTNESKHKHTRQCIISPVPRGDGVLVQGSLYATAIDTVLRVAQQEAAALAIPIGAIIGIVLGLLLLLLSDPRHSGNCGEERVETDSNENSISLLNSPSKSVKSTQSEVDIYIYFSTQEP